MELGVIRQFLEIKVFDAIPSHGSISYKALAEKLGGIDVALLSKSTFNLELHVWLFVIGGKDVQQFLLALRDFGFKFLVNFQSLLTFF